VRLSEDRIKEAILDTDLEIRQRAVRYFAKSFSTDTSVMPLVIKAVETFGREDAYHLIGLSRDLPQTEDTIDWIIDELNNSQSDQYENYTYNLSMVLAKADAALLLPNESAILESPHFLPGLRESFSERLQMLSWDEAACWRELEAFCEEGKDKQYINDVNLGYANHIVEARQLLLGRTLDSESRGLRNCLVETCTVMGERFLEYDEWRAIQRTEKEEHHRRIEEIGDDPVGLTRFALEKLKQELPSSGQPKLNPPVMLSNKQRVGRNAPCPCGSGKKFKKCCINKSSGNPLLN
jgi:hypothetical protein